MDEELYERWKAKRQKSKRTTRWLPVVVVGVLFVTLAVPVSSALLAGPPETRILSHTGFDSLQVGAGIEVKLAQGPFAVTATGPVGDLNALDIKLEGTTLVIGRKALNVIHVSFQPMTVNVTAPQIASIDVSAGADVTAEKLTLTDVKLSAQAGGNITVSGTCTTVTAKASAGADINAHELICRHANAEASAAAEISINASDEAKIEASAAAEVNVYGKPRDVTQNASAGADIDVK